MKILVLSQEEESFKLFSYIFEKYNFFDVDFSIDIPQNIYYDAILAEDSCYFKDNIPETNIILLKNSQNLVNNNIILLEECFPETIKNTLLNIYEKGELFYDNKDIIIYNDIINKYIGDKKIIIQIKNDEEILYKINKSIDNFNIPFEISKIIKIILFENIINCDLNVLTSVIEIKDDFIKLSIPKDDKNNENNFYFSINQYCDSSFEDNHSIDMTFYKKNIF